MRRRGAKNDTVGNGRRIDLAALDRVVLTVCMYSRGSGVVLVGVVRALPFFLGCVWKGGWSIFCMDGGVGVGIARWVVDLLYGGCGVGVGIVGVCGCVGVQAPARDREGEKE